MVNDIYLSLERSLNFFLKAFPYLMFGFILSAYLKIKLNGDLRKRFVHLLDGSKKSIILASIVGAFLPLCSASSVPIANALNSRGVNLGISFAFVVSASAINPIGIMLSLSLLGYKIAVIQILASLILSIFVGFVFYNKRAIFFAFENKKSNDNFFDVFIEQFKSQIPHYMLRHKVKAGITGWAQINGWRGNTSLEKRIECDLYYIERWSIWFDLKILFLTLFRGFFDPNAY